MNRRHHWENVYATRPPEALSWFQREPAVSLRLIETAGLTSDS